MINKTIHYCWFGKNKKSTLAKKCINSWKKHCPSFNIIEWNEENFNIDLAPLYVRQAYEAKKWAFVSDYVRLWALINYGGVYMDTDVEVIKPIDCFLKYEAFSGFESNEYCPTGILGCCKENKLFKEFLSEYEDIEFYKGDGEPNLTTNVERITKKLKNYGFIGNNEFQIIDGFAIFPKEYFCPKTPNEEKYEITNNTYTIHHFAGSWVSNKEKYNIKRNKRVNKVKQYIKRIIGENRYDIIKERISKKK